MADERITVTSREAAAMLGTSTKALDRAVRRGEIPVVRYDRKRRFDPQDLREWVARHKAPWQKKGAE